RGSRDLCSLDGGQLFGDTALGTPEIVRLLHPDPQIRAVAAELAETKGHLGRHRRGSCEDAVKRLPSDAEPLRSVTHGHAERRQYVIAQNLARMRGASVRVALGGVLDHGS